MIVDTAWSEGYSVVVLVPVPEDADEWHRTVTFSHPILSTNVSDNTSEMILKSMVGSYVPLYNSGLTEF